MAIPSDSNIVPTPGFDPLIFWERHKTRIVTYSALIIVAVAGYAIYQVTTQRRLAESSELFAKATTEDDYRQIAQKFPHTVAAGNAILLLSEKLRADQKYDEAISALQSLTNQDPNYPLIDGAWMALGATYEAAGKNDEAIATYQQVTTKFADRYSAPQALLEEAAIYKSQGKLDDARRALENIKSQFADSYAAILAMQEMQTLQTLRK